jgi:hypothetical protein
MMKAARSRWGWTSPPSTLYFLTLLMKLVFPDFMRHRWRDASRAMGRCVAVAMYRVVRSLLSDDSLGKVQ